MAKKKNKAGRGNGGAGGNFFFFFLGQHPWLLEGPRLGVELELQLLTYATAPATQDPSCICDLCSPQH